MPAAAWVTLIIALLIIGITAVGLLRVIFHLRAIVATLRQVTGGVAAVAQVTTTVPGRLPSLNASLKPGRDFCQTVCGRRRRRWVIASYCWPPGLPRARETAPVP